MENIKSQSRRDFLLSSALVGGGLMLNFNWFSRAKVAENVVDLPETWSELTGYIKITPDNVIKIFCPNPEFGQNVMTSLPMMVAEELDCDWKNVVVEMGTHDNVKFGPQFSGGSNSIRMYWKSLRNAGAAARQMLIEATAQTWGVSASEITTKAGVLSHASGKSAKYGEMAAKAATIAVAEYVGPVYLRFGRPVVPIFTDPDQEFIIGKAWMVNEGKDVSIFATGHLVWEAILAGEILAEKGIDAEIINIHTIKPLDEEAVLASVRKTGCAVSAEEHQIAGGLGDSIAQVLIKNHLVPLEYVGVNDSFGESGTPAQLMEKYGLNAASIVEKVLKVIARKNS